MQLIESSMMGVRSARLVFANRATPARLTLFPMVHVGEAEFYKLTYDDALSHDVVLFEGVRSPITMRITRSYRWLVGSKAMAGLIVQPRLPIEPGATARIVHADLSPDEFAEEWRKVPLWLKALLYVGAPIMGLHYRWLGTRTTLAKGLSFEDQPSMAELLRISPETGALTEAILDARDRRLLEKLREELDRAGRQALRLAIVYGAGHMRAVVRELTGKLGYFVEDAEWRTIFTLEGEPSAAVD
jgi:hypothetical protein